MPPSGVNLIALVSKLTRTALILSASISKCAQILGQLGLKLEVAGVSKQADLVGCPMNQFPQIHRASLESLAKILGAKQREHVRDQPRQLLSAGGDLAEDLVFLVGPRALQRRKSSVSPSTRVIGVLNSWLATSMNAVFNWPARASSSLARTNSRLADCSSATSRLPLRQQVRTARLPGG